MNKFYTSIGVLLLATSPVFAKAGEMIGTKSEFHIVMMNFLKVMAGIAISSVVIFIILLGFKYFYLKKNLKLPDIGDKLNSPEDIDSSVRTFLEKSRVD